ACISQGHQEDMPGEIWLGNPPAATTKRCYFISPSLPASHLTLYQSDLCDRYTHTHTHHTHTHIHSHTHSHPALASYNATHAHTHTHREREREREREWFKCKRMIGRVEQPGKIDSQRERGGRESRKRGED